MKSLKKYFLLTILFAFSLGLNSQTDTTVLKGFNYGRNLIVLNPFNANGVGFSVKEVLINNVTASVNLSSSLFDVDFSQNKITLNVPVTIKIVHSKGAPPKIYNPECILDKNLEVINPLDSATQSTNYALKDKSICIITGKLIFETKPKSIDDYWFGFEQLTRNNKTKDYMSQMGNADENGDFIGVMIYDDLYSIDLDYFENDSTTKIVYRFLVDLRGIPEDKKRGQLINLDILVKQDIDERFSKLNLDFPTRKLYYNAYYQSLMWDKDYENAISKTFEILNSQISQENNLKLLEIEKESEKKQKKYLYLIILIVVLITIGSIIAYFRQRKLKKLINIQKDEVEKQKHAIEEKQKEMLDSIRYARRIQTSLLPTEKYIDKVIKNSSKKP